MNDDRKDSLKNLIPNEKFVSKRKSLEATLDEIIERSARGTNQNINQNISKNTKDYCVYCKKEILERMDRNRCIICRSCYCNECFSNFLELNTMEENLICIYQVELKHPFILDTEYNGHPQDGCFRIHKQLDNETKYLILGLSNSRRMARNLLKIMPKEQANKYGVDGEFYHRPEVSISMRQKLGKSYDITIINNGKRPSSQPSLYMNWNYNEEHNCIFFPVEKQIYDYTYDIKPLYRWIMYLVEKIFAPRKYILKGIVKFDTEANKNTIQIKDNTVILNNELLFIDYFNWDNTSGKLIQKMFEALIFVVQSTFDNYCSKDDLERAEKILLKINSILTDISINDKEISLKIYVKCLTLILLEMAETRLQKRQNVIASHITQAQDLLDKFSSTMTLEESIRVNLFEYEITEYLKKIKNGDSPDRSTIGKNLLKLLLVK